MLRRQRKRVEALQRPFLAAQGKDDAVRNKALAELVKGTLLGSEEYPSYTKFALERAKLMSDERIKGYILSEVTEKLLKEESYVEFARNFEAKVAKDELPHILTSEEITRLLMDVVTFVKLGIVTSTRNPDVLDVYSRDENIIIRGEVASSPFTYTHTMERLASDPDMRVRSMAEETTNYIERIKESERRFKFSAMTDQEFERFSESQYSIAREHLRNLDTAIVMALRDRGANKRQTERYIEMMVRFTGVSRDRAERIVQSTDKAVEAEVARRLES